MSEYTNYYSLKKPLQTENYDVDVANTNNDVIDTALYNKVNKIAGKGLSTNDFTDAYKKKLDALVSIFNFCGSISDYSELDTKEDTKVGDVWYCEADSTNYAYNGTDWIDIGLIVDLSGYLTQTEFENEKSDILTTVETNYKTATDSINDLKDDVTEINKNITSLENNKVAIEDIVDDLESENVTDKPLSANQRKCTKKYD